MEDRIFVPNEEFDLEQFRAFAGLQKEQVTELLRCIDARLRRYEAGEDISGGGYLEGRVGIVFDGEVIAADAAGKEYVLGRDTFFGKSFFEKDEEPVFVSYRAAGDCAVLSMSYEHMITPCWFCCYYHSRLAFMMPDVNIEQNERYGI